MTRFSEALRLIVFQPRFTRPEQPDLSQSKRETIDGITIAHLSGSSYQRGLQHGHLFREELHRFRHVAWAYAEQSAQERLRIPRWLARIITRPLLLLWSALYQPELNADIRAEIQGIADGARLPLREVILNTVIWEVFGMLYGGVEHCSEIGIASERTTEGALLGYNYDVIMPGDRVVVESFLALFVVQTPTGKYIAPNTIGTPGLNTAMNTHGVAFGWDNSYLKNGIESRQKHWSRPFMAVLREVALHCRTAAEAAAYLRQEKRPQADICIIADQTQLCAVELAGTLSSIRWEPVMWSCNRLQALVEYDYLGAGRAVDGRNERYAALTTQLQAAVTVADIARILRDSGAPKGRQIASANTCFTVIYQPQSQRLWVSLVGSPASQQPLLAFDVDGKRYPADDIPA